MRVIEECDGYKKLISAIGRDIESHSTNEEELYDKLNWILNRAKQYGEKTGLDPADILDSWENSRSYWYMNYYQECNQPSMDGIEVRVFENMEMLKQSIGNLGFRCPYCGGVSNDPYVCHSGVSVKGKVCNWKSYGLLGCLNGGVNIFVKDKLKGETFFMPVAWEENTEAK